MKKLVVSCLVAGAVLCGTAANALAAKPAVHACLGTTISAEARGSAGEFGSLVASEAHEFGGVGDLVQAFLSGDVPDEAEQNDCNNL